MTTRSRKAEKFRDSFPARPPVVERHVRGALCCGPRRPVHSQGHRCPAARLSRHPRGVYLSAITDWLEYRFGMRRWIGLTLTVIATLAVIAAVAALLAPPVIEQTRALVSGLPDTLNNIQNVLARWASKYPV